MTFENLVSPIQPPIMEDDMDAWRLYSNTRCVAVFDKDGTLYIHKEYFTQQPHCTHYKFELGGKAD